MEAVTTIASIDDSRRGSNARGEWVLTILVGGNGLKYQTFDKSVGQTAKNFFASGLPARLVYDEETKGDFVNNVVTAIEAAPAGVEPLPQQAAATQPAAQAESQPAQTVTGPSEKDQAIHRQTAAKVAAHLLEHFPEEQRTLATFNTVVDELVEFFDHGRQAA